jgi:hypothetical protein
LYRLARHTGGSETLMTIGPDNLGNGAATTQERFTGQISGYRGLRGDGGLPVENREADLLPHNGASLEHGDLEQGSPMPSLHLDGLTEPVFEPPQSWLEVHVEQTGVPLADHPLLRGLLLELPPKGTVPPPGWLDRWFEAARCILELLYSQESGRIS